MSFSRFEEVSFEIFADLEYWNSGVGVESSRSLGFVSTPLHPGGDALRPYAGRLLVPQKFATRAGKSLIFCLTLFGVGLTIK